MNLGEKVNYSFIHSLLCLYFFRHFCFVQPYCDMHPMRAMFHIPAKPAPTFREPELWSAEFTDFVARCLVKDPDERATAEELLEHPFIQNCGPASVIRDMIEEAVLAQQQEEASQHHDHDEDDGDTDAGTMKRQNDTLRATSDATLSRKLFLFFSHKNRTWDLKNSFSFNDSTE